jgi:hypothetical protein
MGPLIALSEGRLPTRAQIEAARSGGATFVRNNRIGWVVIDESRASEALRDLAIKSLRLELRERRGSWGLYATTPDL